MGNKELQILFMLLKIACPHLKEMAARTKNPIDDLIVNIICSVSMVDIPLQKSD